MTSTAICAGGRGRMARATLTRMTPRTEYAQRRQAPIASAMTTTAWTGRWFDEETGLYYFHALYNAPQLGRFLKPDPVGYEDGINLYAYVGNDPLDGTHPTGEWCIFGTTCPAAPPPDTVTVTA